MDRLAFWLYRGAAMALALLPLRIVFALGSIAGRVAYALAPAYRRLALRNLRIAFGQAMSEAERRALARAHFASLGGNLLAGLRITRFTREQVRSVVEIEGLPIAEEIIRAKRGFVLVISHIGNWELLAQLTPLIFPCPCGTVYQRLGNPFIDAEVRASRARLGLQLFERKEGFQGALQVLRAGGGVGVLVDQHAGDAGVWCPFFGRLASTSSLAAMMALRTGAALLPAAVYTEGGGRWKMVIRPPVEPKTRDANAVTAEINLALEEQIRARPADWFWVHNRWKTPRPKFLLATYKRGVETGAAPLQPFPVLIRSTNWLGDAVMSLPAVRAIKHGRPDLHLAILCAEKLADFWRTIPEVDEVIGIPAKESPFAVARRLRGRFEAALVFPNSLRSALEVWWAGIPRRVGYAGHRRRWLLDQVWKEKKNKTPKAPRHQVHHYLELAKFIGAEPEKEAIRPSAQTGVAQASLPVNHGPPAVAMPIRIGLCPGAEYGPAKRWLPERFREVMTRFSAEEGGEWWLFGVGKDAAVGKEILTGFTGAVQNRIGATTLAQLIEELKACAALVTNDTGTMHLAAALGVPVIAIFGSTEPHLTGPLGDGHRVLRHHVECSPCFLRECPIDFRCMKAVNADEVLSALRAVLAEKAAPRG
jgi:lipopolysaccharide heptosyltransferase II